MNGAGAAAISITNCFFSRSEECSLCDRKGAIYEGRTEGMNPVKERDGKITNLRRKQGLWQRCWLARMYLSVYPHLEQ